MSLSRREFLSRSAIAASAVPALGAAPPALPAAAETEAGPGPAPIRLRVNGTDHDLEVETRTTLLDALRWQLGLSGTKEVCDRGSCGACTVLLDGVATLACMTLAVDAAGREITTIEGLGTPAAPSLVQRAFAAHDAVQCGYCTPGLVVATEAALRHHAGRSGVEPLKAALAGNQCRCGSYGKVFDALHELAGAPLPAVPEGNRAACLEPDLPRVDGPDKVCGRAVYSADQLRPGMLFARHLLCPFGRARLLSADVEGARRLPGVIEVELETGREFRYSGAPIGHVCAESPAALRDAVGALRLEWDFDFVETDPLVLHEQQHGGFPGRDLGAFRGAAEADQALAAAAVVVEATYRTQVQVHTPLEPHGAMVDPTVDPVECWVSTQGTFDCVEGMQQGLELDPERFQIRCEHIGGGFGSKLNGAGREGLLAAQLARRHGRPVRVFNDREGEMLDTGNRPGSLQWYRLGASRDGKLLGGYLHTVGLVGVGGGGGVTAPFLYDFGAVARRHEDVAAPHGAPRPFRAPGRPQGTFGVESVMDELAEALAIDPVELRVRNETSAVRKAMLAEGARRFGWSRRLPSGSQRARLRRGFGVGGGDWGNGKGRCEIRMTALPDGEVHVYSGMQDIGTGERTVIVDLAADALGLPREAIVLHLANSHFPYGPGSGGSTTARLTAPAVRAAAAKLKPLLPVSEETTVEGSFDDAYWGRGGSEAVQFVELTVDAETGVVRLERVLALQCCGQVVNRQTAENQIYGGVIQGIGYALFEDRATDPQLGCMMNANLERYQFPGPLEVPAIEAVLWGHEDGLGVRGLGEPCTIPTAGAIANAVANALGVRVRELPITPDRVLRALEGRS